MYFPCLNVRGEESEAIIATICKFTDNKVIPILIAHGDNEEELFSYQKLDKVVSKLIEANKKFIIKIYDENDLDHLRSRFPNLDSFCIIGIENSNYPNVNVPSNVDIAIIHVNDYSVVEDIEQIVYHIFMPSVLRFQSYINNYPLNKTVFIEDGFIKHEPNDSYPRIESFNSELCFTYLSRGLAGFGDFTILEEGFYPSSGANPNYITHVIHLTKKKDSENRLEILHYLVTPSMVPDNRDRSKEVIKLVYNARASFLYTEGIRKIESIYPNSTSLGMYKRIGIMHHIELINSLI